MESNTIGLRKKRERLEKRDLLLWKDTPNIFKQTPKQYVQHDCTYVKYISRGKE